MAESFINHYMGNDPDHFSKIYQVLLTGDCNLKCKYCYEKLDPEKSKQYMNYETCDKIVKKIVEMEEITPTNGKICLQLFGGEPTLNIEAGEYLVEQFIKNIKNDYVINLSTNGTIMNDKIISFLKKYKDKLTVTLSLDGKEYVHDLNRGGYKSIIKNLETYTQIIDKRKIKIAPALTPDTVQYLFEGFVHFVDDLKMVNIKYNIEMNNAGFLDEAVAKTFKEQIMKCADYILKTENINNVKLWNLHYDGFKKFNNTCVCKCSYNTLTFNWYSDIMSCNCFSGGVLIPELAEVFNFGNISDDAQTLIDNKTKCVESKYNREESVTNFADCINCEINSGCKKCSSSLFIKDEKLYGVPFHCKVHKAEFEAFKYMLNKIKNLPR